jgi:hypothetical protein
MIKKRSIIYGNMKNIYFNKNGGKITARIRIEGNIHWSYKLEACGNLFTDKGPIPGEFEHTINFTFEEMKKNIFQFNMMNDTKAEQAFLIEITWMQNKKVLDKWKIKDELNPGAIRVIFDQANLCSN